MALHRQTRPEKNAAAWNEPFLAEIDACWTALATGLAQSEATTAEEAERLSRQFVELALFLQFCQARRVVKPTVALPVAGQARGCLRKWIAAAERQIGSALVRLVEVDQTVLAGDHPSVAAVVARLSAPWIADYLAAAPPEVLGWVHLRLLELRLAPSRSRRAVRASRVAKKVGGVFYTPECVIRYMVANTLGRQVDTACSLTAADRDSAADKGPRGTAAAPALRILDPACGCGFFLLGVCRHLVDWCGRRGIRDAECWIARCLHGADVDAEAVLAARRSLWLELVAGSAGGRGPSSLASDVLAELTGNIRCGDALAESAWPDDLARFDVLLGNPPYRRELHTRHLLEPLANTPWGRRHHAPRMDLWYYFVHRGLELLAPGGRLSFIVGSYWTSSRGAAKLISALQENAWIEEIFSLGKTHVFPGVSGRHMILSLVKGTTRPLTTIKRAADPGAGDAAAILTGSLPLQVFHKTAAQLFRAEGMDLEPPADDLLARLESWPPLGRLGHVRQGIVENPASVTAKANRQHGGRWRDGEGVFALTPAEAARLNLSKAESRLLRAYHHLGDVGRYFLAERPSRVLIYSTAHTCPRIDVFPALRAHLARFRPILESRRETRLERRPWWQLHWPREERVWESGKLICVQMARRPAFAAAAAPVYVPFSVNVFVPHAGTREDLNYLAALLNSRLLWKWFSHHAKRRGVGLEINGHVLARAPIRTIDFDCSPKRDAHHRLVDMAREMTQWTGRMRAAESTVEKAALDRRLAEMDREIDRAVYALYGLTEAEIALVEGAELSL